MKTITILNSMKSRYFMLVACVTLLLGVSACSSEEFGTDAQEVKKEWTKQELIEQALSRIPKTRATPPYPVIMVATNTTVSIMCFATEEVVIHWGDGAKTLTSKYDISEYYHTYSDDLLSHGIYLETSNEAIQSFDVSRNGLIFLDFTDNTNLASVACEHNNLSMLNLTGCPNLGTLWAYVNELSSIDLPYLPHLHSLYVNFNELKELNLINCPNLRNLSIASNNLSTIDLTHLTDLLTFSTGGCQFTNIDLSKNTKLESLYVGEAQITNLDLTKNTELRNLSINELPIKTLNNSPINDKSFAIFSKLEQLSISNTFFTSLDLSNNPLISYVNISKTAITQLDISNLQIKGLDAMDSQLTNLTYKSNNLKPATYIRIDSTPFEQNYLNLFSLISVLPDRNEPDYSGYVHQGELYTNSSTLITSFLPILEGKNWVIKP